MGLAATQVRMLSLTSRQHMIEYKAQKLQAQKLQLSNESDSAYNSYMTALDATKVQYKYVETDGAVSYKNATYNNMFSKYNAGVQTQYSLTEADTGKLIITDSNVKNNYALCKDYTSLASLSAITSAWPGCTTSDAEYNAMSNDDKTALQKEAMANKFAKAVASGSTDSSEITYYENLYNKITSSGGISDMSVSSTNADSYTWLSNMIANASVVINKWDSTAGDDAKGAWTDVSVSTDSQLEQVSDDVNEKKAEATYEADMTRINKKDSQYDTLLSQTDTERTAIKTEIDSLKQVSKDNIDKAFKLFS